jgi:hypothetical protein
MKKKIKGYWNATDIACNCGNNCGTVLHIDLETAEELGGRGIRIVSKTAAADMVIPEWLASVIEKEIRERNGQA